MPLAYSMVEPADRPLARMVIYIALPHPLDELINGQMLRFDSFERCDVAAEDVVNPLAGAGFFKAYEVFGLFDDAEQGFIPPRVGTDLTDRLLGEIVADFTASGLVFEVPDGVGQAQSFSRPDF